MSTDVALWHLDLAPLHASIGSLSTVLSADEWVRARQLKLEHKRAEYIIVRAALRRCLAQTLGCATDDIAFSFGAHGKPILKAPQCQGAKPAVHFNVSHSHGRAVIALSKMAEVGVDVEKVRHNINTQGLAKRFFSPLERQTLRELGDAAQLGAFFCCWARKEAVIKCDGRGISVGLGRFDVSLRPDEPARILRTGWRGDDALDWSLFDIDVGPGHRAALAVRSRSVRVSSRCFRP